MKKAFDLLAKLPEDFFAHERQDNPPQEREDSSQCAAAPGSYCCGTSAIPDALEGSENGVSVVIVPFFQYAAK